MTRRLRLLTGWAWYPTCLALLFVIDPFTTIDLDPRSGMRLILSAVLFGVLITAVARRVAGPHRGGALAAIVVMAAVAGTTVPALLAFAAAIALLLLHGALAHRGAMKAVIPWPRVNEALNILVAIVLVLQVGRVVQFRLDAPVVAIPTAWSAARTTAGPPDVFVLLADGHGRRDVLARDYGFRMAPLVQTLSTLGFEESPRSMANHVLTRFSLSVLFNGRPLAELGQDMTRPVNERLPFALLEASVTDSLLRTVGYESVVISSGFEHLGMRRADDFIDVGPRNELEQAILARTAVGQVAR